MTRAFILFFTLIFFVMGAKAEVVPAPRDETARYYIQVPEGGLPDFFKWHPRRTPLVSHHRGGPAPGFPENSIEAMENALKYGPGLMEVDVFQLNDGTLILMHDYTLGRTTTGAGKVADKDWEEVKKLYLKDSKGQVTDFRVPKLADVIGWARGKTILTLDIKRGTDFKKVADLVAELDAEDYSVAIAYSLSQAEAFHRLAPNLPITVSIRNLEELQAVKSSSVAHDKVIAWTGTRRLDPSLYAAIHREGWTVFMGTLGREGQSLDSQYRDSGADRNYLELIKDGVDVIATDRFWAVQQQILNRNIYFFRFQKAAGR